MCSISEPKVSVIIPVHNGSKFLRNTVKGILKQTYENMEVILVENASTDNSWELCLDLEKSSKRIKATKSYEKGTSLARKKGIEIASGKYITFSDQDDSYINNNSIQMMVKAITEDGTQVCQFGHYRKYLFGYKRCLPVSNENKVFDHDQLFNNEIRGVFGGHGSVFNCNVWMKIYDAELLKHAATRMDKIMYFGDDEYLNILVFFDPNLKKVSARAEEYYVWNMGTGFSACNNDKILFDEYECIKPLCVELVSKYSLPEHILRGIHLETIYFMKYIVCCMIEEKESQETIYKEINRLNKYGFVGMAKAYFQQLSTNKKDAEIEFLASEISAEEYYEYCKSHMPNRNIKRMLYKLLRKIKK